MAARFSDIEISAMIAERKALPPDFWRRVQLRRKRGHSEREITSTGISGYEYRLILRQSNLNPLDFSVIVAHFPQASNLLFRLRRYNGRHEHSNKIEGSRFYAFHVHLATERYQDLGMKEDSFAEPCERYADFSGALRCALSDCCFDVSSGGQQHIEEMLS